MMKMILKSFLLHNPNKEEGDDLIYSISRIQNKYKKSKTPVLDNFGRDLTKMAVK